MIIRREDIQQIHTLRLRCISETGWAVSAEWVGSAPQGLTDGSYGMSLQTGTFRRIG
jgi:hypothetical protein